MLALFSLETATHPHLHIHKCFFVCPTFTKLEKMSSLGMWPKNILTFKKSDHPKIWSPKNFTISPNLFRPYFFTTNFLLIAYLTPHKKNIWPQNIFDPPPKKKIILILTYKNWPKNCSTNNVFTKKIFDPPKIWPQ